MVNRGSDPNLEPGLEAAERRAQKTILPLGFKPTSFKDPLNVDEMLSLLPGQQPGQREREDILNEFRADPLAARERGLGADYMTQDFLREGTSFERAREKIQGGLKPSGLDEAISGFAKESLFGGPIIGPQISSIADFFTTPTISSTEAEFRVDPEERTRLEHLDRWFVPLEQKMLKGVTFPLEALPEGVMDGWKERNQAARKITLEEQFDANGLPRTKELGNLLTPKQQFEIRRRLTELGIDRPWYERLLGGLLMEGPKVVVGQVTGTVRLTKNNIPVLGKIYENASILAKRRVGAFVEDPTRIFRGFDGRGLKWSQVKPGPVAKKVLNPPDITNGLSRYDEFMNIIRPVPYDSVMHPTFGYRNSMVLRGESVSTSLSHEISDSIRQHFPMNQNNLVTEGLNEKSLKHVENIPEAGPSIGDIAENLDKYWPHLTGPQKAAMRRYREMLNPYEQVAIENEIRNIIRFDRDVDNIPLSVLDESPGPFYWPRGSVDDGLESASGRIGASNNSAKTRREGTHAAQIERQLLEDRHFPSPGVAVRDYIADVYRETSNKAVREYAMSAVDPVTGKKLASTSQERLDPYLRDAVTKERAKIASRVRTSIGQSARINTLKQIENRQQRARDAGTNRLTKAEERFGSYDGYTPADMAEARADLGIAREETISFTKDAGEISQQLKFAKGNANKDSKKLDALIEEWNKAASEAEQFLFMTPPGTPSITDINKANALSRKMTNLVTKAADAVENSAAKVDDLIEKGDLTDDILKASRQETVKNNKIVRNMTDKERTLNGLKRDVTMLERDQRRLNRALENATNATERAQINSMITDLGLNDARVELQRIMLSWTQAKEIASQVPLGERAIKAFNLQGVGFPGEVAKAINREMDTSDLKHIQLGIESITNLHRSIRSTADFSAPGIQGLLAMHNAPKATQEAMKVMFKAIGSEHSLGAYMGQFNIEAKATGRLQSSEWARHFLRIGGAHTEFKLGTAQAPSVAKSSIEMFNRSFGYYGDAVRLQWADSILRDEMAGGGWLASYAGKAAAKLPFDKKIPGVGLGQKRTLQEIIDSGDMERIAKFVNNATGWTEGKSFGTLGDIALFAPRFLQSRLTTTLNAVKGTVPGASIENRLARRAVFRLIGQGTLMTVGLNAMLGNETDFRPFLDENFAPSYKPSFRKNSNFMRVRIGGRDFSLFGTYDSLVSIIMNPASSIRSLASGPVQALMDLYMFEENAIGEQNPDPGLNMDFGMWALGSLAPFSFEEAAQAGSKALEGDLTGAAAAGLGGTFGLKSSPITTNEEFKEVANNAIETDPSLSDLVGKDYFSLDGPEQERVLQNSEVNEAWEQRNITRDARNAGVVEYKQALTTEHTRYTGRLNDLALTNRLSNEGKLKEGQKATFGRSLRTKIAKEQAEHYGRNDTIRKLHSDASDYTYEDRPGSQPVDEATAHYIRLIFDDDLEDDETLHFNYKERDKRLDVLRNGPILDDKDKVIEGLENGYGDEIIDIVEAGFRDDDPDIIKKLRADRDLLSGYFTLTEDYVIENGLESKWREYLRVPPAGRKLFMQRVDMQDLKGLFNYLDAKPKGQLSIREQWVKYKGGEEADRALIFWGYRNNPVFDNVRAEFEATEIKRAKEAEARRKFFASQDNNQ